MWQDNKRLNTKRQGYCKKQPLEDTWNQYTGPSKKQGRKGQVDWGMDKLTQPVELVLGYDGMGNPITYKYVRFESRGIGINAATRSGKTTEIFDLKKQIRDKIPDAHIVSIAQDRDEFRQRDDIPFFIVGNTGEIPIDVGLARQTGEKTRMNHANVIVDLNSLETEKEQDEFASEFIKGVQLDRDESFWEIPCFLFIDEVQTLCTGGATKFPKTRDAIVNLAKTCLKKGILPIVVSHRMKDFYVNARDEITNHVVGYLDNTSQQEFACELLKLSYSAVTTIDGFGKERGKFFVRGYDISDSAVEIQARPYKLYGKGRVIVPKLSLDDMQRANAFRESITMTDEVSLETRLRFESQSLQAKIDELSQTQMTEENVVKFRSEGFKIGYNKALDDTVVEINNETDSHKILGVIRHGPRASIVASPDSGWRKKLVIE